jgi:putative membrane protein
LSEAEVQDAGRRTRLANERTYLAWWRTGLTALAVCVGLGRIVPSVTNVTTWPYQAVGAGYGVVGVTFMVVAHYRMR